jgi:cob(I)alamin adenosyltransferase
MKKKINLSRIKKLPLKVRRELLELLRKKKHFEKMRDDENNLKLIYDNIFDAMTDLVTKTNEPQMVASTMVAQALRLYKTIFATKEEFDEAIKSIVNQAKRAEPFVHTTLH